jgi:hypothetical protein
MGNGLFSDDSELEKYWIHPKEWGFRGWSTLFGMAQLSFEFSSSKSSAIVKADSAADKVLHVSQLRQFEAPAEALSVHKLLGEAKDVRTHLALKEIFHCLPYVLPCWTCASNAGVFIHEVGVPARQSQVLHWLEKLYLRIQISNKSAEKKTKHGQKALASENKNAKVGLDQKMDQKMGRGQEVGERFLGRQKFLGMKSWSFFDVSVFLGAVFMILKWEEAINQQWAYRFISAICVLCPDSFLNSDESQPVFLNTKADAFSWLYSRPCSKENPKLLHSLISSFLVQCG